MAQSFLLDNYLDQDKLEKKPTRDGYGDGLVYLGNTDKRVVVLCADISDSTRAGMFRDAFPDRFIETGIAEQNMAGLATGLALMGKIPFMATYAVFCPGRNWDQIRVSICYNKANVKLSGAHAGVSVGPDGATHQALEDIAITRCLPNMIVLAPADANETKQATIAAAKIGGPVYLRFARDPSPVFIRPETPFVIGRANVLREGKDLTIIACGPLLYQALLAAEELGRQGQQAEVINLPTIKPIDKETIIASVKKTGQCVTVEEHQIYGGLGSAVAEVLSQNFPAPLKIIGMPDKFGTSGTMEELWAKFGLDKAGIVKTAAEF